MRIQHTYKGETEIDILNQSGIFLVVKMYLSLRRCRLEKLCHLLFLDIDRCFIPLFRILGILQSWKKEALEGSGDKYGLTYLKNTRPRVWGLKRIVIMIITWMFHSDFAIFK